MVSTVQATIVVTVYYVLMWTFVGLMISGFARSYQVFGTKSFLEKAIHAAEFVKKYLYNSETGTLARTAYRDVNRLVPLRFCGAFHMKLLALWL